MTQKPTKRKQPTPAKPKRAAAKRPKRTRARPRQIYLSREEDEIFSGMLAHYSCNASKLVRDWLWRAQAQFNRRHTEAAAPVVADKRQMRIEDAIGAAAVS